ncbi:MAG: OmpA family protein [Muribaculaceae bacterium]|jgi:outer membrane protein OmpA-like peptidoglycan-associated protein|nr:OmpA family protein [Muribaculaceae bacterium]
MKKYLCVLLSAMLVLGFSGCGSLNNAAKGGLIGGGGGAAIGAGIGALIGKGKGAAIGGAIGAVAGGVAGTLIGKKMDKQREELARISGAQVDTCTDVNGFEAIRVTFDSGILFGFNSSKLSEDAKASLSKFATSLINNPQTDVQIYGHTDNVGTRAANDKVSTARANEVKSYLVNSGVPGGRLSSQGLAYDYPVASNDTEAGRAQNRRVEIYITANEDMIKAAQDGTLK